MNKGLLLTLTEPPPGMEEEFNAWYDTEHLAERLSIPGFRSARRWVADVPPGEGKYLATYELDSPEVLRSPAYLARFKGAPTPWTQRCLGKAVVFKRWACEQVTPGEANPHPAAKALAVVMSSQLMAIASVGLQVRSFVPFEGEPCHIALIELASATLPAELPGGDVRLYRAYAA